MSATVKKSIDEQNIATTLKSVLREIVLQNGLCTVLTNFSIEDLGKATARVTLTFDDAKCEKPQSP